MYALNARAPMFTNETFMKLKAYFVHQAIMVGYFNTPFSSMERSGKNQLNRDTVKLTEILNQMDLTDTYRTLHSKSKEYTFFLVPCGTLSKTDHIIGHKTGLISTDIKRLN